jgi:hypothetical protein
MNVAQFDPKRQDMATLGKMIPQDKIWWAVSRNSRAVWPSVTMSCLFGLNWAAFIGARCLYIVPKFIPRLSCLAKSP